MLADELRVLTIPLSLSLSLSLLFFTCYLGRKCIDCHVEDTRRDVEPRESGRRASRALRNDTRREVEERRVVSEGVTDRPRRCTGIRPLLARF